MKVDRFIFFRGHMLKLKKNLCGLRQSPRNFFMCLKENLEAVCFELAADIDPCLVVSEKVICLTYVDDCIMVARHLADIMTCSAEFQCPITQIFNPSIFAPACDDPHCLQTCLQHIQHEGFCLILMLPKNNKNLEHETGGPEFFPNLCFSRIA